MRGWLYVFECIAVPCLLGTAIYFLFNVWDRSRRRAKAEDALPVIDYLI